MDETITVILAGGEGKRLTPLTDNRAKPAVPFGGKYRIIDFTLANCLHSGLRKILVLTQYKSHSLQKHLRDGWSIFNPELGEYITAVPPQMRTGDSWYQGTADAIYQNLYLLQRSNAKYVVVLSGDHIYRMDYAPMLRQHIETDAALTVACMNVTKKEATAFGVMQADVDHRVIAFEEKPANPATLPDNPDVCLASMGIYIFSLDVLEKVLQQDAINKGSSHDFGKDIIPAMIDRAHVYAYRFGGEAGRVTQDAYWRDVGTIDAFYQANMDLLLAESPVDLYQQDWPIRTYEPQLPPARTVSSAQGNEGIFINSIISSGVVIAGGSAQNSVLFPRVSIGNAAVVINSILFEGVKLGEGAHLENCVVDKYVEIPPGTVIGVDKKKDAERFHISDNGVVVISSSHQFN
ncbi:glucose-1-phosphate adenylyltransferase [Photobacterium marinum]|uniref:glucose-1-phosphate adenylyltransferase n=1 Tax=Photobacterium marinum TaxID=1056511 RepID=UPI00056AC88F|nr:glucose-1-phosphate adenylyltransferase [Photobacterium marinum]